MISVVALLALGARHKDGRVRAGPDANHADYMTHLLSLTANPGGRPDDAPVDFDW